MNQEAAPHPPSPISDVQSLADAGSVGGDPAGYRREGGSSEVL
jgi:hypothetical protein